MSFGNPRKPLIFMVFEPGGSDHDSSKHLFSTLETQKILQPIQEESRIIFEHFIFKNLKNSEIYFQVLEEAGTGHPEDSSTTSLKNLYMGSVSIEKHEITGLPIGTLKIRKCATLK